MPHWGNPSGTRLPTCVPPIAMEYLRTVLVPKGRLFAYQDGFMVVAMMFFAALLPALLMRRRHT